MHYYQFNIADYRKDTTHLSRLEHSIYRDLIDWFYLDEAPIPLDLSLVSRKLRLCSTDDERALKNVLTDFFECTNEGYTQKRIQQEIDAFRLTIANASKAGKASAEARKNKQLEHPLNERSTNHKPITNNQEPIKDNTIASPSGFAEFWSAYPKKVGKGAAEKAWKKSKANLDSVLAAIKVQASSEHWRKDSGQFIPNPAKWINERRWEDGISCAVSGESPDDLITLPNGQQITRKRQQWLMEMSR